MFNFNLPLTQRIKALPKWLSEHPRECRLIFTGLLLLLSLMVFEEIADDIFADPKEGDWEAINFDHGVMKLLAGLRSPRLNQVMIDFTALGSLSVIGLLILLMLPMLIAHRDWRGLIFLSVSAAGTATIPWVLKEIFARPRPESKAMLTQVETLSFPSGHAFAASVLYLSLAYLAARQLERLSLEILYYFLASLVIVTVAFSRIYLGVHYPSDVVGGLSSGLAWFLFTVLVMELKSK